MAELIAHLTGIITSASSEDPAQDLKLSDPERWVDLKKKDNLPAPFYHYSVDQHTGDGQPLQFKVKDYDTSKPMLPPFTNFDEQCVIKSWAFKDGRNGLSVKPTDKTVKKVTMSFEDDIPLGQESKPIKKAS
ncbi:hypothetical protein [Desulfobacter vibrioformis]|uniref:hypothetical protein n=1 Tax=Desulfobacter vibrioformis TaxID=34031 RepID=UPI0005570848|nr:hypothetical protein [Desulfobacter vibrioformis]